VAVFAGIRNLSGLYVVIFNPKILTFYEGGWTAIDWQYRRRLRGKPLALWLHGYLASHAKPYPGQSRLNYADDTE